MNSDFSLTKQEDATARGQTTRRRWLAFCGVVGIGGLAGCIDGDGDEDDEPTDDTDPNDFDDVDENDEPIGRIESDSFAYEWESRQRVGDEWRTTRRISGHVTGDGNHFEEIDGTWAPREYREAYGVDGTVYILDEDGECRTEVDESRVPSFYESLVVPAIATAGMFRYGDPVGTTTIEGLEVEIFESDASGLHATAYITVDDGQVVGYDTERYGSDGELVTELTLRIHSFGAEFSVTPPPEC